MNLFSKNANFEDVKKNNEALAYHVVKFQFGHRYPLAIQCFAHIQVRELERKNAEDFGD